jgi:parvulin-like peptidyl-prolyl isomerase
MKSFVPSFALFGCLAMSLFGSVEARATIVDRIAATVNSEVITLSEVYELGADYIESTAHDVGPQARVSAELEVLEELISRELVKQQIQELGLDVTPEEVDRAIDDISMRNGVSRQRLREEVVDSGLEWDVYRDDLIQQLRQMKFNQIVLQPRFSVSDDELRTIYNREVTVGPPSRAIQGVMLPYNGEATLDDHSVYIERLNAVRDAFLSEEISWEEMILAFPESVYASAGGEMSAYAQGELVGVLDEVVFSLEMGVLSEPIETLAGVFMLRVSEEIAGDAPSFESLRPELESMVNQQKFELEMELWVTQARRVASVDIKLGD